jgi:hypothetical protein
MLLHCLKRKQMQLSQSPHPCKVVKDHLRLALRVCQQSRTLHSVILSLLKINRSPTSIKSHGYYLDGQSVTIFDREIAKSTTNELDIGQIQNVICIFLVYKGLSNHRGSDLVPHYHYSLLSSRTWLCSKQEYLCCGIDPPTNFMIHII